MSHELPPPSRVEEHKDSQGFVYWQEPLFTADQMQEYARTAVLAERERIAKMCDEYAEDAEDRQPNKGFSEVALDIAAAIRKGE